jgi:hypothetical protein
MIVQLANRIADMTDLSPTQRSRQHLVTAAVLAAYIREVRS